MEALFGCISAGILSEVCIGDFPIGLAIICNVQSVEQGGPDMSIDPRQTFRSH